MADQGEPGVGSKPPLTPAPPIHIAEGEEYRPRIGALAGHYLGEYQLRELLAVGGMAEVYIANDLTLQRDVAVKVLIDPSIDSSSDKTYAMRFRAEARRVAAFTNPHIVPVYFAGEVEVGGRHLPYLVMPLLRESLREVMRRRGQVPIKNAVEFALQAAEGLEAAHRRGLVHRDVKPENILIDADGQVLIADFGIAREIDPLAQGERIPTPDGKVVGTPQYMAPEQMSRGVVDQRADIFGLGVVLYEMLTGTLPFPGDTPYQYAMHALHDPPIPPSVFDQDITPALEQTLLIALARDPEKRFPNIAAFSDALRRALEQPVRAPQPSLLAIATDGVNETTAPNLLGGDGASPAPSRPRNASKSLRGSPWVFTAAAILVLACVIIILPFLQRPTGTNGIIVGGLPGFGGGVQTAQATSTPSVTAQPQATTQITQTPPNLVGNPPVSQPTASPSAPGTPTVVAPTATVAPGTALTLSPSPLVLTPTVSNTCSATQIITNDTNQTVGWAWQPPKDAGFRFTVNGGASVTWPSQATYIPAGGQATLVASVTCQHTGDHTIVVKDSVGGTYTFTMKVSS